MGLKKDNPTAHVLCLSGGGLRATFFHLGVVRVLAKIGLLDELNHIFSVSGGSILAGHMALNWDSYRSPDDAEFDRVAKELISLGTMDVRGRILRYWIPGLLGRTRLLQHYLNTLYKDAKLGHLPDRPEFHFLTTRLTSGQLCSFSKRQWAAASANPDGGNFTGVKMRR